MNNFHCLFGIIYIHQNYIHFKSIYIYIILFPEDIFLSAKKLSLSWEQKKQVSSPQIPIMNNADQADDTVCEREMDKRGQTYYSFYNLSMQ